MLLSSSPLSKSHGLSLFWFHKQQQTQQSRTCTKHICHMFNAWAHNKRTDRQTHAHASQHTHAYMRLGKGGSKQALLWPCPAVHVCVSESGLHQKMLQHTLLCGNHPFCVWCGLHSVSPNKSYSIQPPITNGQQACHCQAHVGPVCCMGHCSVIAVYTRTVHCHCTAQKHP